MTLRVQLYEPQFLQWLRIGEAIKKYGPTDIATVAYDIAQFFNLIIPAWDTSVKARITSIGTELEIQALGADPEYIWSSLKISLGFQKHEADIAILLPQDIIKNSRVIARAVWWLVSDEVSASPLIFNAVGNGLAQRHASRRFFLDKPVDQGDCHSLLRALLVPPTDGWQQTAWARALECDDAEIERLCENPAMGHLLLWGEGNVVTSDLRKALEHKSSNPEVQQLFEFCLTTRGSLE